MKLRKNNENIKTYLVMLNENMIANAQSLIDNVSETKKDNVKVIRKEMGLIERTQNEEKIILTEDNRQVLFG